MKTDFDIEKAIADLLSGKDLTGKDGVLTPLIIAELACGTPQDMPTLLFTDADNS